MPISVAQIAAGTATVHVSWGNDIVTVVYHPGLVTEKIIAQLQSYADVSPERYLESAREVNALLCRLVKSWDVYEDEAQTALFPLDPERVAELPFSFRSKIIVAIMQDISPEADAPQIANE